MDENRLQVIRNLGKVRFVKLIYTESADIFIFIGVFN